MHINGTCSCYDTADYGNKSSHALEQEPTCLPQGYRRCTAGDVDFFVKPPTDSAARQRYTNGWSWSQHRSRRKQRFAQVRARSGAGYGPRRVDGNVGGLPRRVALDQLRNTD